MQRYTFQLQDGKYPVDDGSGVWLEEREQALGHAEGVARELMRGREQQTRAWRLDVYEDGGLLYQISFASLDPTLDHLAPKVRATVEASCKTIRSARETVSAAHATMRESRALVALSRGKPYLATERGEPTIRSITPAPQGGSRRKGSGTRGA
jgi:Domain of unknown function (DUF6894)